MKSFVKQLEDSARNGKVSREMKRNGRALQAMLDKAPNKGGKFNVHIRAVDTPEGKFEYYVIEPRKGTPQGYQIVLHGHVAAPVTVAIDFLSAERDWANSKDARDWSGDFHYLREDEITILPRMDRVGALDFLGKIDKIRVHRVEVLVAMIKRECTQRSPSTNRVDISMLGYSQGTAFAIGALALLEGDCYNIRDVKLVGTPLWKEIPESITGSDFPIMLAPSDLLTPLVTLISSHGTMFDMQSIMKETMKKVIGNHPDAEFLIGSGTSDWVADFKEIVDFLTEDKDLAQMMRVIDATSSMKIERVVETDRGSHKITLVEVNPNALGRDLNRWASHLALGECIFKNKSLGAWVNGVGQKKAPMVGKPVTS